MVYTERTFHTKTGLVEASRCAGYSGSPVTKASRRRFHRSFGVHRCRAVVTGFLIIASCPFAQTDMTAIHAILSGKKEGVLCPE